MTVQTAVLRYDPVLVAVARSPLPPRDLVVGAVRTAADVRRVCVLWALHVAANESVTHTVRFSKIDGILTCQLSIKDKL